MRSSDTDKINSYQNVFKIGLCISKENGFHVTAETASTQLAEMRETDWLNLDNFLARYGKFKSTILKSIGLVHKKIVLV